MATSGKKNKLNVFNHITKNPMLNRILQNDTRFIVIKESGIYLIAHLHIFL